MKLRVLLLTALLLSLLPSIAMADEGHGHKGVGTALSDARLASGLAALGNNDPNVSVVPPGGSSQAAVVCTRTPSPP